MGNVLAKIYQDIDCGLDGFFILICSQAPDKSNLYLGKKKKYFYSKLPTIILVYPEAKCSRAVVFHNW